MKKILMGIIFLLFIRCLSAQTLEWEKSIAYSADSYAESVIADKYGNIYVAGVIYNAQNQFTVLKFNPEGELLWERLSDNFDQQLASCIDIDSQGYIYAAGTRRTNGSTIEDISLYKYDQNGNTVWTQFRHPGNGSFILDIAVDHLDNIYLTGQYSAADNDIILLKYNSGGVFQWQRQIDLSVNDWADSLAIDKADNIYISGGCQGPGSFDMFILKYSSAGVAINTQYYDSGFGDEAYAVLVDKENNLYIAGCKGTALVNDSFIIKSYTNFNRIWTNQYNNYGKESYIFSMAADSGNYIYTAGNENLLLEYSAAGKIYFSYDKSEWNILYETDY